MSLKQNELAGAASLSAKKTLATYNEVISDPMWANNDHKIPASIQKSNIYLIISEIFSTHNAIIALLQVEKKNAAAVSMPSLYCKRSLPNNSTICIFGNM